MMRALDAAKHPAIALKPLDPVSALHRVYYTHFRRRVFGAPVRTGRRLERQGCASRINTPRRADRTGKSEAVTAEIAKLGSAHRIHALVAGQVMRVG